MAQLMNVRLSRVDAQPWGLRLQGGKDFGTPLVVQKVSDFSCFHSAGLNFSSSFVWNLFVARIHMFVLALAVVMPAIATKETETTYANRCDK